MSNMSYFVAGVISVVLIGVGIVVQIFYTNRIGNLVTAIVTVLCLFFGGMLGFRALTKGRVLVGPFLVDRKDNVHLGFYLKDESSDSNNKTD